MATTAHFPVNTLALKRGGLVKAVRERANAVVATKRLEGVFIDVLAAQPRLSADVEELQKGGHLHPQVQVRSVLAALDESVVECREPVRIDEEPDVKSYAADQTNRAFRLFRDGIYERYVRFDDAGIPVVIDYFSPSRQRVRRQELDASGRTYRFLEFQQGSTKATVQRYIGRDGKCFLTIWQKPGEDAWGTAFLHGPELELKSSGALYAHAYDRMLAGETAPAICSEFRENLPNLPAENLDDIVRKLAHTNLLKIVTVHSNHLQAPYLRGSGVSPNWKRTLIHLDEFDALVALTEAQKDDLAAEYGHADRIRVIGQVAPPAVPLVEVDPYRLVLVARTHPKKRVDQAMRVFAHVHEREPRARLEVFGFGYADAEEAKVRALISELGISDAVKFMPFTSDPGEIYGNACVTLLTSASEGFPLILLESMSQGVPVLAFDSNYGPRDVISDSINGFLVPFGENEELAQRVVDVMGNPDLRAELGRNAQTRIQDFGAEAFVTSWLEILEQSPRPSRKRGMTVGPVVLRASWFEASLVLEASPDVSEATVLEFRRRGSGECAAQAELVNGSWNLVLPPENSGVLLDAYLLTGLGEALRVQATALAATSGDRWRLYATANGFLSAKPLA